MKGAGVDSLPGGGAEIFADRVRHIICDHKIDGDQWLDTARLAHQIWAQIERDDALRAY
jgi:aminodeoxyfutalosine synthase